MTKKFFSCSKSMHREFSSCIRGDLTLQWRDREGIRAKTSALSAIDSAVHPASPLTRFKLKHVMDAMWIYYIVT